MAARPPFADYFDLQLRVAAAMSEKAGTPFREAMALYTNLGRRVGIYDLTSPAWAAYLDGLEAADDQLAFTMAAFDRFVFDPSLNTQAVFGCFSCDRPDETGMLRIHFTNRQLGQEPGPLSAARIDERMAELRAMFGFIKQDHPTARLVRGGSWLYNLEAYRRLFPAEYVSSCRPTPEPVRIGGTSTWGQMVDHRGLVRPEVRQRFLAALERLNVERPWTIFPLRALAAEAPVEVFFDFYGL